MKSIYGKNDFKTLEKGQENCYLMTNGLGGFSSLTMAGSVSRNDHGILMAAITAPNKRFSMVHRLKERLETGESKEKKEYVLSSQEFANAGPETGYRYLNSFTYEDTPVWRFQAEGVEIRKEAAMKQGANAVALRYEIMNRENSPCCLTITPFFQFVSKGADLEPKQRWELEGGCLKSQGLSLFFRTNGEVRELPLTEETYYYSYDACDGRRENGRAAANHEIMLKVEAGASKALEIIYEMEPGTESAKAVIEALKKQRFYLAEKAGFQMEPARTLAKSAAQFISHRESTGGETILAGFPFFEDWGRDTMIALPGICLSTGQYETAKQILRTFSANERNGLMPNLFPEGGKEPFYNTVDAALLFINCVYLYYRKTKHADLVKEMYPVMKRIIENYKKGTEFGIHMEGDGLIAAGEGLAQVTWMDVRIGDILPTARHGKPVEINAYWYNALCIMEEMEALLELPRSGCCELAAKVKASFIEQFWLEEKNCLRDLVSGTKADEQVRCNQIWAVSMPFSMLDREKELQVVEKVFKTLYTPYGLRTLEPKDPEFKPHYGGLMLERDLAYHQGTVWPFPLGAYYLSYLKVNGYGKEAKAVVKEQLEVLESAMREGCIGQIPEIYDGLSPSTSKGCFAQAWSVGEILRVYEKLEEEKGE